MRNDHEEHDEFVERVAGPLRTPERADATFEARVMSAVLAQTHGGWWSRPFTLRLTPLTTLAAAAAFALMVLAANAGVRRVTGIVGRDVARQADTVILVRFVFTDSIARSVTLVGSFNHWRKDATPLGATGTAGTWAVSIPLRPGRHEYAFIVNDGVNERWVADPFIPAVHDEYGTESSIMSVKSEAAN